MTPVAPVHPATALPRALAAVERYWFPDVPGARLAVFSRIVHAVVLYTVLRTDTWASAHAHAPVGYYEPIQLARAIGLGPPTPDSTGVLRTVLAVAGILGIVGLPRLGARRVVNAVAAVGYLWWTTWAFSYGKVDHDRLTLIVALFVLAVVPGSTRRHDPAAGWALRTVQVVFVLAYPLSALSKLRNSGVAWMSSAVFARAIVRRGTQFGDWFAMRPAILVVGQWAFIAFEFVATLALLPRGRVRSAVLVGILGLHVVTFAAITIHFLPHTICLTAFAPLERLSLAHRRDRQRLASTQVISEGKSLAHDEVIE